MYEDGLSTTAPELPHGPIVKDYLLPLDKKQYIQLTVRFNMIQHGPVLS